MQITPLPALDSNYIWLLHDEYHAVAVDPGDAAIVQAALARRRLTLAAILLTHHHQDHIGGVPVLRANAPQLPIYGPADERMAEVNRPLADGDEVVLFNGQITCQALAVPGHTRSHLAYYSAGAPGLLFCGDTLFSAGCGRIFEGTPAQMHAALQRLAALPGDTEVYCTHEYTLANLTFAAAVEPDNAARDSYRAGIEALRADNQPSLPSRIEVERSINPFLRTGEPQVRVSVAAHAGHPVDDDLACFAAMRAWKDVYQG